MLPEYNGGYTAPAKNALDVLRHEWARKPIGLVSYGGVFGGLRAAQALKPVLASLRMIPMREGVIISFVRSFSEGDGDARRFVPNS